MSKLQCADETSAPQDWVQASSLHLEFEHLEGATYIPAFMSKKLQEKAEPFRRRSLTASQFQAPARCGSMTHYRNTDNIDSCKQQTESVYYPQWKGNQIIDRGLAFHFLLYL
jgi:hypothetical protein